MVKFAIFGAAALALVMFWVTTAFFVLPSARRIRDAKKAGVWVPRSFVVIAYVWLVVGVPADAAYNWTIGVWRHRMGFIRLAWPQKVYEMYSSRIQRLVRLPYSERPTKATRWAHALNVVDPGHIEIVD